MGTDDPQDAEGSELRGGETDDTDGFDRPLEVDVGPRDDASARPQDLDEPNLTDPASRTLPSKVPAKDAIEDAESEDRRGIRKKVVYPVLIGAGVQFVVADLAFFIYGFSSDWTIPSQVMTAWLSATVVQVVGVVLVVMRYLFPPR